MRKHPSLDRVILEVFSNEWMKAFTFYWDIEIISQTLRKNIMDLDTNRVKFNCRKESKEGRKYLWSNTIATDLCQSEITSIINPFK